MKKILSFFRKSDKKDLVQEAISYQPDAMEIRYSELPILLRYCGFCVFLLLIGALLWSILCKTDKIVQARGKLISDIPDIVMKPIETAVLKSIDVRVGDIVRPGQVLATFDHEVKHAELERLQNELDMLNAQFERLTAEFKGVAYAKKPGKANLWQYDIYAQRQGYYREKIVYYDQEIKRIVALLKSTRDTLAKQQERLTAVRKIENMFTQLHERKATSLRELLETSMARMEIEANVDKLQNSLSEYEHERLGVVAAKNSFVEEWRNSVSEKMVEVQRELTATLKTYDKSKQQASYIYLKAPCEAMVHEIAPSASVGSAVGEAEALLTLVPLKGKIEVEAEVLPQDIGEIKVGDTARVKLTAFPFQKHGTLDGAVVSISENTLSRRSENPTEGSTFYRVRLALSGKLRNTKAHFRLIPGMESQVELKVGRRRVIEYIIYPLIKAFDEAVKEP